MKQKVLELVKLLITILQNILWGVKPKQTKRNTKLTPKLKNLSAGVSMYYRCTIVTTTIGNSEPIP